MREIILKALKDIADCNGNDCQINLASESARIMIADKLEVDLDSHVQELIEEILCPPPEKRG